MSGIGTMVLEKFMLKMIAIDMDGTLLGADGRVSDRNAAALRMAERAGVEVVVATGRRHCYAMRVLRGLELGAGNALVSSNGAVIRAVGNAKLVDRTLLGKSTAEWLCAHLNEFRNALVMTFDLVGEDGEDAMGALVVEELEELHGSIGKWMEANKPYISHVVPMEKALAGEAPIQMMLCGTVERMRRAEARLREHPRVMGVGVDADEKAEVTLHRTEYPERDLSIVDILPAGCSKGAALRLLSDKRGHLVLNAQLPDCMAIGDNWNDVSMLEVAGHGVLMANAPDDLKALAAERGWVIGGRHDEDGVALAIEAALGLAAGG